MQSYTLGDRVAVPGGVGTITAIRDTDELEVLRDDGKPDVWQPWEVWHVARCPRCHGARGAGDADCAPCRGTGYVPEAP